MSVVCMQSNVMSFKMTTVCDHMSVLGIKFTFDKKNIFFKFSLYE